MFESMSLLPKRSMQRIVIARNLTSVPILRTQEPTGQKKAMCREWSKGGLNASSKFFGFCLQDYFQQAQKGAEGPVVACDPVKGLASQTRIEVVDGTIVKYRRKTASGRVWGQLGH